MPMTSRRFIEIGLWSVGLTLVLVYVSARAWSEYARVEGIEEFRQQRSPAAEESSAAHRPRVTVLDQSLWSRARRLAFAESSSKPGTPEAVLRLPSVHLEVPVYPGTSELNLNRGAGHIEGTAGLREVGNVGIAAHRDGFFRKLKDLEMGADVYLDVADRSTHYRVVGLSVVSPSDTHALAASASPHRKSS
jgi:sortase A